MAAFDVDIRSTIELYVQLGNQRSGIPGTGTLVSLAIEGTSPIQYLDFNDLEFKTSGWTTKFAQLAEEDASGQPGYYNLLLDLTTVTNLPSVDNVLVAKYKVNATSPTLAVSGTDRFHLVNRLSGYYGAVWLDEKNGAAGTVVGVNGTKANPSNSQADAATLLADPDLQFRHLKIRQTTGGTLNLSAVGTWDQFLIEGLGNSEDINVSVTGADVDGSEFLGITVGGDFNRAKVRIVDCLIDGASNLENAVILDCRFRGVNTFSDDGGNGGNPHLERCTGNEAVGGSPPELRIVHGGTPADVNLHVHDWHGDVQLGGASRAGDTIEIDLAGDVTLLATNTAGMIDIHGIGTLVDQSAGATVTADAYIPSAFQIKQGWVRSVSNPPGNRLNGTLILLRDGLYIPVPDTARLSLTVREYTGGASVATLFTAANIAPIAGSGFFQHQEDPFTPTQGGMLVFEATITGSGVGDGSHTDSTPIATVDLPSAP